MSDRFIITNGSEYAIDQQGGLTLTTDKSKALIFRKAKSAWAVATECRKLEGFYVAWYDTEEIAGTAPKRKKFVPRIRTAVYQKTNGICSICGDPISENNFTIDHIIPLSKGGTDDISNLQPVCRTCNQIKNNSTQEELLDKIWQILLYNIKPDSPRFREMSNTINNF